MQRRDQAQTLRAVSTDTQEPHRAKRHSLILGFIFILVVAMLPPRQPPPSAPPALDSIISSPVTKATPSLHLGSSAHTPPAEPDITTIQPEAEPLPKSSVAAIRAALTHSTPSD